MKELPSVSMFVLLLIFGSALFGCDRSDQEAVEFSMQVIPESMESIPGQRCVFLVTVEDKANHKNWVKARPPRRDICTSYLRDSEVNISAIVGGASSTVAPHALSPGQVAEVTVIPDEVLVDWTVTLTVFITAEQEGLRQTETVKIAVSNPIGPTEQLLATGIDIRDKFIPWLAADHPELAITSQTEWITTIVRPNRFEVTYCLFFSEEWEMGLRWHLTIPPTDWTEIYLRHRTTETIPSQAFRIESLDAQDDPHVLDPPESVWR